MRQCTARFSLAGVLLLFCVNPPIHSQSNPKQLPVFILAGQSNMEGQAVVDLDHPRYYNGGRGTLKHLLKEPRHAKRMGHLRQKDGRWTVREDVFIRFRARKELKKGPLAIGFTGYGGRHHFGPELQFGHRMGDHYREPVLLIKTAWGGKSLYKDFRPPGAEGETGPYFKKMVEEVREALSSLSADFPRLKGYKPYLAGFVWLQGWNDMVDAKARGQYEENLIHLIRDVRKALKEPKLPVVIGELGNGGPDAGAGMKAIRKAQKAAAEHPQWNGTVAFVSTTAFARPAKDSPNKGHGHHWFGNAESYFLIGDALGKAMINLIRREK